MFPEDFVKEEYYIYPWLTNVDTKAAAGSTDCDDENAKYIPEGAHDSSAQPLLPAGGGPGGNPALYDVLYEVSATVKNTGSVYGEEVAQMVCYISLPYIRSICYTCACAHIIYSMLALGGAAI